MSQFTTLQMILIATAVAWPFVLGFALVIWSKTRHVTPPGGVQPV